MDTMSSGDLCRPRVLLLDEHLAALDPGTQRKVLDLTVSLVSSIGCTTVMVTHNMDHAIELGDRLLVMSRGTIVADYQGTTKRELTVPRLVDEITSVGDTVSDRSLLAQV
jgi:putative ABC transport system ATP-binding protein